MTASMMASPTGHCQPLSSERERGKKTLTTHDDEDADCLENKCHTVYLTGAPRGASKREEGRTQRKSCTQDNQRELEIEQLRIFVDVKSRIHFLLSLREFVSSQSTSISFNYFFKRKKNLVLNDCSEC